MAERKAEAKKCGDAAATFTYLGESQLTGKHLYTGSYVSFSYQDKTTPSTKAAQRGQRHQCCYSSTQFTEMNE